MRKMMDDAMGLAMTGDIVLVPEIGGTGGEKEAGPGIAVTATAETETEMDGE